MAREGGYDGGGTLITDSLVSSPNNPLSVTNLYAELTSGEITELLTGATKAGESAGRRLDFRFCVIRWDEYWLSLEFLIRKKDTPNEEIERFTEHVRRYVDLRRAGHTIDYAYAAIREQRNWTNDSVCDISITNDVAITTACARLKRAYWIPDKWLQRDPLNPGGFVVIDGKFAWVYTVNSRFDSVEVRDAQEYDPKLKAKFDAARKEVESTMTNRNIKGFGSIHFYWQELRRTLKNDHGIEWRSPSELNPNICYD
jgi:hypothetical protein